MTAEEIAKARELVSAWNDAAGNWFCDTDYDSAKAMEGAGGGLSVALTAALDALEHAQALLRAERKSVALAERLLGARDE